MMGRIIIISFVRGIVNRNKTVILLDIRLFESNWYNKVIGIYFQILIFQLYSITFCTS